MLQTINLMFEIPKIPQEFEMSIQYANKIDSLKSLHFHREISQF